MANAQNKTYTIKYNIPYGDANLQEARDAAVVMTMFKLLRDDKELRSLIGTLVFDLSGTSKYNANGPDANEAPALDAPRWRPTTTGGARRPTLTVLQLKDELRSKHLPVSGTKSELLARLKR